MNMENYGGMTSTGETPDSSTGALWKFYRQLFLNKGGGAGEGNNKFCLT
jgi:hypothetical protein